jgi:hypothetical protein
LAPLPQRTLDDWHRLVASGDHDPRASLSSEYPAVRLYCVPIAVRAIACSLRDGDLGRGRIGANRIEMIEFEVMVRRITAPGGEMGTGSARDRAL